jgi:hypothetical protein
MWWPGRQFGCQKMVVSIFWCLSAAITFTHDARLAFSCCRTVLLTHAGQARIIAPPQKKIEFESEGMVIWNEGDGFSLFTCGLPFAPHHLCQCDCQNMKATYRCDVGTCASWQYNA